MRPNGFVAVANFEPRRASPAREKVTTPNPQSALLAPPGALTMHI
jgi:hypothetical protein